MFEARLKNLRINLSDYDVDVLLVSNPFNIYYLTGFAGALGGDRFFLTVAPDEALLVVDFRYLEEAKEHAAVEVVEWRERTLEELREFIPREARRVGFEADHLTVESHRRLSEAFTGLELVSTAGIVQRLRMKKDEDEIARISEAAKATDAAFEHALGSIGPGVTERELAREIDHFMRVRGADKAGFETIVASGRHSAVPHWRPVDRPLAVGEFVIIDLGANLDGYCSDMTRTVVVGKASERRRELYETVLRAQNAALEHIGPGVACKEADAVARSVIEAGGRAGRFGHGLGHGVGIEVHEAPTLSAKSDEILEEGMVVTVEPGIYVDGFGGVRIEDLVVITEDGKRVLSRSPKELIEV